jgi:outer membrane protein assembly factor BamB
MRLPAVFAIAGLILSAGLLPLSNTQANEWSRFRGPSGGGIAAGTLPDDLGLEKNLLWKAECGKGASSPIVVGSRVFLTSFNGDERQVKCFDAVSGVLAWSKSIDKERTEVATAPGGPASPTAVADASSVYAFFPDVGLWCLSHTGDERWRIPLGPFQSFHGIAASLVLAEGNVILLIDQLQDSFVAAFDCKTGTQTWKVDRQDGPIGGYSTPATRTNAQGTLELVVSGPMEVVGYDAATGKRNWSLGGATNAPISVPVVADNQIFLCEPSFGQNPFKIDSLLAHDKNKDGELSFEELEKQIPLYRIAKRIDASWGNGDGKITADELEKAFESFVNGGGLVAIELDETNVPATARVKWTYRKSVPQIPSLLLVDNVLFFISDGGILTSVNPDNGEILKRARLGEGAKYYASPIAAGGRILLLDTEGKLAITTAQADWKVLGTNNLNDRCYATPAIANDRIFIRGDSVLYCLGNR